MPLVDWTSSPTKWRTNSDEGKSLLKLADALADHYASILAKLLFDLGLLRTPPVEQVLQIAATSPILETREKALRYFLDGCITRGYGSTYSPSKHDLAFVPALDKGKDVLGKPTEVYGNHEAALLDFLVLSPKFAMEESRFRLSRDPPSAKMVAALLASPPRDIASASKLFAYLSAQVSREPSFTDFPRSSLWLD